MRTGILLGGLIIGARGQAGAGKPYVMEVPQVMLPATVTGERKTGPDFMLYYFMQGEKQILFAYVGGFPQFPKGIPPSVKPTTSSINGMPATTYVWKDDKGGQCRETLVRTGHFSFARVVHFAYAGLTDADARIADGIIASTLPEKPSPPVALTPTERAAIATLKSVPYFAVGGVGIAGQRSPGEAALRVLLAHPRADAILPRLLMEASFAGRLYALLGLHRIDPKRFGMAISPLLSGYHMVEFRSGYTVEARLLSALAEAVDNGDYDRLLSQP